MNAQDTSFTLQEILSGISASLNEAQHQLRNMEPYDEWGRPNVLYTLPYLDFDIKLETKFQSIEQSQYTDYEPEKQRVAGYIPMYLISFKPVNKTDTTDNAVTLNSNISGRFVAVAPNEGLPQIFIQETITQDISNPEEYEVEVRLVNAAGEKIPGAKVEINFVPEESDAVSTNPYPSPAEVLTGNDSSDIDNYGVAKSTIHIGNNAGKKLVFEINMGNVFKQIAI